MDDRSEADKSADLQDRLASAYTEIARMRERISVLEKSVPEWPGAPSYKSVFLMTWYKSVDFLTDDRFMNAYRRGMDSGHVIGRALSIPV